MPNLPPDIDLATPEGREQFRNRELGRRQRLRPTQDSALFSGGGLSSAGTLPSGTEVLDAPGLQPAPSEQEQAEAVLKERRRLRMEKRAARGR